MKVRKSGRQLSELGNSSAALADVVQESTAFIADVVQESTAFIAAVVQESTAFIADVVQECTAFIADVVQESTAFIADVVQESTAFIAACYGYEECATMSDVRFKMWKVKTSKANIVSAPKLMSLPPTNESFQPNVLRAHL